VLKVRLVGKIGEGEQLKYENEKKIVFKKSETFFKYSQERPFNGVPKLFKNDVLETWL